MSVNFRPFIFWDLFEMDTHQEQYKWLVGQCLRNWLVLKPQMEGPWSWTALADGKVIAMTGILESGQPWSLLGTTVKLHMVRITRAARNVLEVYKIVTGGAQVIATVDPSFTEAVRWAKALGFRPSANDEWIF